MLCVTLNFETEIFVSSFVGPSNDSIVVIEKLKNSLSAEQIVSLNVAAQKGSPKDCLQLLHSLQFYSCRYQ